MKRSYEEVWCKPLGSVTILVWSTKTVLWKEIFNLSNDLNAGELEESEEENGIILIHGKETDEGSKIDVETFKNHVVKFRNESRRVMRKINDHTADDVHIVGANYYKSKWEEARNAFGQVRDDLDKVIDELDPDSETEWIEELENILSKPSEAVKNENEVKDKMAETIEQHTADKLRNENDMKKEHKVLSMQIRIGYLKEKSNKVWNSSLRLNCKQVSKMADIEIHANLHECKDLEERAE